MSRRRGSTNLSSFEVAEMRRLFIARVRMTEIDADNLRHAPARRPGPPAARRSRHGIRKTAPMATR